MTAPTPSPAAPDAGAAASRVYWRRAALLALAGMLCAVLLGGLSAWFLGAVAIAGLSTAALTFNFHVPGALVRLFAVGRTVARYGERLAGHKAALTDQVDRRVGLFRAMADAPATRSAGWQMADQARLSDYLDDVEDLDYARLRVGLPGTVLAISLAGGLVATAIVAPLALVPPLALLGLLALAGRSLRRRGFACWDAAKAERRDGAARLGATLAAAVPLRAERHWSRQREAALARFYAADGRLLAIRRMQAGLDAAGGLVGPVAALSVIGAAWLAGGRGEALLVPTFLAFAWLALGEPLQGVSRMLVAQIRRDAARRDNAGWLRPAQAGATAASAAAPRRLLVERLQRRAPDGRPLGLPLALDLQAGRACVLAGPSGTGKTSLLKQVAGWTGNDTMRADGAPIDAAARRAMAMYCPHDAAILADTVRANLFAPGRDDAELDAALAAVEMSERVSDAGGLDGWIRQEALSLGEAQRLNLARAWLSDRPLILLDEPTEHLDAAQGERILARLLDRLGDRIVVLSSHRLDGGLAETIRL